VAQPPRQRREPVLLIDFCHPGVHAEHGFAMTERSDREPGSSAKIAAGTCGVFDEYALDPG
jgi:hypothetical protein